MSQILEQEKARLILDLNQKLKRLQKPFITQDIETGIVDVDILEEWKIAYAIEKEIDSIGHFFLKDAILKNYAIFMAAWSVIMFFVICSAYGVGVSKEMIEKLSLLFMEPLLVMIAVLGLMLITGLAVDNLPSKSQAFMYDFLASNFTRKKVTHAFEPVLMNNYQLQKPTGLYPDMLTPTIMNYFARNKHLAVGFPGDFSSEKRQLQRRTFLDKLNPWSVINPSDEVSRLFVAYELFHSGKPVLTFNHLIDAFADPYFQSLADRIMGQVLLILSSQLIDCTTEEKKHCYQLMRHCAKNQPDSFEFLYASYFLQHPDSEDMPIEWRDNVLPIQKSIELCNLDQDERKAIVKMLGGMFNPVEPLSKKIPEKKHWCFFPEVKIQPEVSFDETYLRLNGMKVFAKIN